MRTFDTDLVLALYRCKYCLCLRHHSRDSDSLMIFAMLSESSDSCGGGENRTLVQTTFINTIYTAYRVKLGLTFPPLCLI
jgi:hypothetical protein